MAESKKTTFTKAQFLTPTKFAIKYNLPRAVVVSTVSDIYKKNLQAKTPRGYMTPIIVKNRATHGNGSSMYLIHPLFHAIVLKGVEKRQKMTISQTKGKSHEI